MCGRYFLNSSAERVEDEFGVAIREAFPPRYNIGPGQPVGLIRQGDHRPFFALARWGFIPSWAKPPRAKPVFNARSETVAEKAYFKHAFKRRRCLVPADGFYEWSSVQGGKVPFCVRPVDKRVVAFAGVWETAVDPDGGEIDTAAILTTEAGSDLKQVHIREPVVIAREDYARWLETDERFAESLSDMFAPQAEGFWRLFEVSKAVGNVRNDGPDLIEPLPTQAAMF